MVAVPFSTNEYGGSTFTNEHYGESHSTLQTATPLTVFTATQMNGTYGKCLKNFRVLFRILLKVLSR